MDRKIFFIHIPKTAGSSFNTFLKGNFSGEDHCERYLCSDCETLADLDRLKGFDYISGHLKLHTFVKNEFLRDQYFLLTFLRNPFDQLLSHLNWVMYAYDMDLALFNGLTKEIQELSYELRESDLYNPDTFVSILQKHRGFQNNQSRFFVDEPSFIDSGYVIELIEQLDMIGITECYKESLEYFVALYGLDIEPIASKVNVNPKYRIGRDILENPLIWEFLKNYNAVDIEVYNHFSSEFYGVSKTFNCKNNCGEKKMTQAITLEADNRNHNLGILDQYVKSAPSSQVALDIFSGEWASKMPEAASDLRAGNSPLFEDVRIDWADKQLGGFAGKKVLEIGPLEAGHTYMMEQLGADSITAIEANSRAYLKCLIVKEILGLTRSKFLLGDALEYLKQPSDKFDICVASGVLYHMESPVEFIDLISQVAERVFIWTHYYDETLINKDPNVAARFSTVQLVDYKGFRHMTYRQEYGIALGFSGFCGGSRPFSSWMKREDILSCLTFFGFSDISIHFDTAGYSSEPSFAIVANRL